MVISREVRALSWKAERVEVMNINEDGGATASSLVFLSGVSRGQIEHNGSFMEYAQQGVVRRSLDSCLLLSSFCA